MREAAEAFETRFGVRFATLTHFPAWMLAQLHTRGADEAALMANVHTGTQYDPALLASFDVLTRIANLSEPSVADRAKYLEVLQHVYRSVDASLPPEKNRLVVAPEREGRMLAGILGWLHPYDLAPHAKRIPYEHGLLVGISDCNLARNVRQLVIVDGAIASGATIMALLALLAAPGMPVEIFSVHAAREGLRAILRTAAATGLSVRVHAGHVTDGLSQKFYAVAPDGRGLAVGDLGDMIDSVVAAVSEP